MTYQIRDIIAFNGHNYDIELTMDYFRNLFVNDGVAHEYYTAIMSTLVELRAGYPYEHDEFVNAPDGGYATLDRFFEEWGIELNGGAYNPIDLSIEDEMEEEIEYLTVDLVSNINFFNEIEELDIMNDPIGDFSDVDTI